jgi:hypothetical protein
MPVYYSKHEEEQPVFHVFLGCGEGSKIAVEDRIEKVKKRAICQECLVLMKHATWVVPENDACAHGDVRSRTGT